MKMLAKDRLSTFKANVLARAISDGGLVFGRYFFERHALRMPHGGPVLHGEMLQTHESDLGLLSASLAQLVASVLQAAEL